MKKIQKLIIWIKRNIYYLLFFLAALSFCLVLLIDKGVSNHFSLNFSFSKNLVGIQKALIEPADSRTPSNFSLATVNPYLIPAGTQMVIPPWVLEQYQLSQQQALYGDVLNFLIYNYGVAAPSADDSDVDTYYIPLSVYDSKYDYSSYGGYDDYDSYDDGVSIARDTVMVDVTKLQIQQPDSGSQTVPDSGSQTVPDSGSQVVPDSGSQATPEGSQATPEGSQEAVPDGSQVVPDSGSQVVPDGSQAAPDGSQATLDGSQATPEGSQKAVPDGSQTVPDSGGSQVASDSGSQSASDGSQEAVPEGSQEAVPEPRPKVPGDVVLEITEDIDKRTTPLVPSKRPETDLTKTYPATCDKAEEETEASAPCIGCVGLDKEETNSFLNKVSANIQNSDQKKNFSSVPTVFCKECYGVDVNDFFQHIEKRAKEEKVPSAIMFAFMLRESNGDCNAKPPNDENSFGLFQLNIKNSTKLEPCASNELSDLSTQEMEDVCEKGYRKAGYPQEKGRCLNNPYCNFEEAIHLVNEKWNMRVVNRGVDKPTETDWVEMGSEGRNLWRNAIIAYNRADYLSAAENQMKTPEMQGNLDNWEIKRMFFVKNYLYKKSKYEECGTSNSREDKRCKARNNPEKIIHNLAYVERITGRETKDGLANSSMCQWLQFKNNNPKLSCNK